MIACIGLRTVLFHTAALFGIAAEDKWQSAQSAHFQRFSLFFAAFPYISWAVIEDVLKKIWGMLLNLQ